MCQHRYIIVTLNFFVLLYAYYFHFDVAFNVFESRFNNKDNFTMKGVLIDNSFLVH